MKSLQLYWCDEATFTLMQRVFGLDLMRATAIVLVVFWHSYDAITYLAPGFQAPLFLDGVDLFFVLSGYLIGGILLRVLGQPGLKGRQRLGGFWTRRLLRTLPNYYLFLAINTALALIGIREGLINLNALAYVPLLHNLWKPFSLFYWESWSLVAEVWFYLAFPVAALAAIAAGAGWRAAMWWAVALFLVVPFVLRWRIAPSIDSLSALEINVREVAVMRMDTIAFGIAAALVHERYPAQWRAWRWPLFIAGAIGVLAVMLHYGPQHLRFSSTWNYTFSGLSMALLLPLMASWRVPPPGGRAVTELSLLAYATYLVHLPLRKVLEPFYAPFTPWAGWVQLAGYWCACLLLAWVVYRFYEKPLMDLRERVVRP